MPNKNMKKQIKIIIFCSVCLLSAGQAEMLKCVIKKFPEVTNYFDSQDKNQRKKCLSKPQPVLTATGERIASHHYKSPSVFTTQKRRTVFQTASATTRKCPKKGGTVKVNGRVFHIDPKVLCAYTRGGKGSISRSYYVARHRRLPHVNANFRRKISPYVTKTARKYGMDPAFVHAVISAESAYNPNARSHVGAMGLMQLMPFTAKRFGVRNAYNPYQNIDAGTRYLKMLYQEFGSLELAAAGYNAGEGAVRKYNRSIPPYRETQKYVPKVMAFYRKYQKNRSLITGN